MREKLLRNYLRKNKLRFKANQPVMMPADWLFTRNPPPPHIFIINGFFLSTLPLPLFFWRWFSSIYTYEENRSPSPVNYCHHYRHFDRSISTTNIHRNPCYLQRPFW